MEFKRIADGEKITLKIKGMIDTNTSSEVEKELSACIDETTDLTIDMEDVKYVSSAGLRVILKAHKNMDEKGTMTLINLNDLVAETFDITGFSDIINIK